MTTATESLAVEFEHLSYEQYELSKTARAGQPDPETRERLRAVSRRLREIAATPPDGYALPKAAADLIAHAEENGWLTMVQWTPPGYSDEPYVRVQVGRKVQDGELSDARGNHWKYSVTWHSRGCVIGKVRLFGRVLAETPDRPAVHDGPSVEGVREVIAAHPAPTV